MRGQRLLVIAVLTVILAGLILVCAGHGDCFDTCSPERL